VAGRRLECTLAGKINAGDEIAADKTIKPTTIITVMPTATIAAATAALALPLAEPIAAA
jgi:hypothetical protein